MKLKMIKNYGFLAIVPLLFFLTIPFSIAEIYDCGDNVRCAFIRAQYYNDPSECDVLSEQDRIGCLERINDNKELMEWRESVSEAAVVEEEVVITVSYWWILLIIILFLLVFLYFNMKGKRKKRRRKSV